MKWRWFRAVARVHLVDKVCSVQPAPGAAGAAGAMSGPECVNIEKTDILANTVLPNTLGTLGSKVAFTIAVSGNMHGILGSFQCHVTFCLLVHLHVYDLSKNTCKHVLEGGSFGSLLKCRPGVLKNLISCII